MIRASCTCACFVVMGILCCGSASGFNSYPRPLGVHDAITEAAAQLLSFEATDNLKEAVRAPDWDENDFAANHLSFRPNQKYAAFHHFDRDPGMTGAVAFSKGSAYLQAQMEECVGKSKVGRTIESALALGRALHAIQDFASHSNLIDLETAEAQQSIDALWDPAKQPPAKLQLTAYDPAAKIPGIPDGDPFPHDLFSKDSAGRNSEAKKVVGNTTKFELAKLQATALSSVLLKRIRAKLTGAQWSALTTY